MGSIKDSHGAMNYSYTLPSYDEDGEERDITFETAKELKELLGEEGLLNDAEQGLGSNQYRFYVSDMADKFRTFANSILKYGILSAKTINIENY